MSISKGTLAFSCGYLKAPTRKLQFAQLFQYAEQSTCVYVRLHLYILFADPFNSAMSYWLQTAAISKWFWILRVSLNWIHNVWTHNTKARILISHWLSVFILKHKNIAWICLPLVYIHIGIIFHVCVGFSLEEPLSCLFQK